MVQDKSLPRCVLIVRTKRVYYGQSTGPLIGTRIDFSKIFKKPLSQLTKSMEIQEIFFTRGQEALSSM